MRFDMDLISVIIPVYNSVDYLEQAVSSVLEQTYQNIELIIVDDGSTDESGELADLLAKDDPRIKVIHQNNHGLVYSRKIGLQNSKGCYIGFVDSDDWIAPNMYEALCECLKEYDVDMVTSGRIEVFEDGRNVICENKVRPGAYRGEECKEVYYRMLHTENRDEFGVYPTVWDKLFKRKLIEKVLPYIPDNITVGEDVACSFACLASANSFFISNNCYYYYRQRQGSMLRTDSYRSLDSTFQIREFLKNVFIRQGIIDYTEESLNLYIEDMVFGYLNSTWGWSLSSRMSYVFPYRSLQPNRIVAIYGAGKVGKSYFRQLKMSGYAKEFYLVDKSIRKLPIYSSKVYEIDELYRRQSDYVVIAIKNVSSAMEVKNELINNGILDERIIWDIIPWNSL